MPNVDQFISADYLKDGKAACDLSWEKLKLAGKFKWVTPTEISAMMAAEVQALMAECGFTLSQVDAEILVRLWFGAVKDHCEGKSNG